jgi:putrescine aminotransferase
MKREGLVERVRDQIGPYFRERWLGLGDHPMVGEARMKGCSVRWNSSPTRTT